MGLDQYIFKAKKPLDEDYYEKIGEIKTAIDGTEFEDVDAVIEQIAYFRKDQWLHNYFDRLCEEKTNHGLDNCDYLVFSAHDLHNFIRTCEYVLHCDSIAIAQEELPIADNHVYDDEYYDEWYFDSIKFAVKKLKPLLVENTQYVYWAWW